MILNILQHTPPWVWVIFCGLIALGYAQTRPRQISRARATVLPVIFMILSLSAVVSAFGQFPSAFGAWVLGFWAALRLGGNAVAVTGAAWVPESGHFKVPGSWLPLWLIVGTFTIKYVAAVTISVSPALAASELFAVVLSLTYGALSGLFWGRAVSLRRLARTGSLAQPA
jgi:hypothetical protein